MSELAVIVLDSGVAGGVRELHVSRAARRRYGLGQALFTVRGRLLAADLDAARQLAAAINDRRDARRFPELAVSAADLYAAGLLHEVLHLLIQHYRETIDPRVTERLLRAAEEAVGSDAARSALARFVDDFPPAPVARGERDPQAYLLESAGGMPNTEVALEELLLLWLANENPALGRMRELFDDTPLRRDTDYLGIVEAARTAAPGGDSTAGGAAGGKGASEGTEPLTELLRAPILASPTLLAGQLTYVLERWPHLLGRAGTEFTQRLLRARDVLAEGRTRGAPGPGPAPVPTVEELSRGPRGSQADGPARFSPDSSWMPGVVLLAKSTYVWLAQLSRRYGREIRRLDQIPDAELDLLAERGFTALWLIGLWQRSEASRRIKELRGQVGVAASAYALHDYVIAPDLGGEAAYEDLSRRALRRGIRLASDMVPNHVGLDARWVVEHPERFIQLDHPPYPGYSYSGPDLSSDPRVGIYLEDHYYDGTDAAVVFKRVDRETGEERFIYHGNDGTTMPWNDTAQLDYLKPEVREAVLATILEVARKFSIIRFDAAMTLAKEHFQRLWYPVPGEGGAIPSRAEHGSMPDADFDRAMPGEFWRTVVDTVAVEAPDTLLLAEAFWLMEGYFVRTLGMHRVYNSAFMNMLKTEANADFRRLVRNVLEYDPGILGRFVNFMNNPDEETAVAQFGKDDKYFGVCTLLATMPGLPMFGHGQIEGLTEKYGMEYTRPRLDEEPDPWLVERHQREIFPLLLRRPQFADASRFRLYDFVAEDGAVNEDVIAYTNVVGGAASLVAYHNRFADTSGRLHLSVPVAGEGGTTRQTLFEALGLEGGPGRLLAFRDHHTGLEHLVESDSVRARGLELTLRAYGYTVLLDLREVRDSAEEPYRELASHLSGRGVPDLGAALMDLRFAPLHDAFGDLLDTPSADIARAPSAYRTFLAELGAFREVPDAARLEAEFEALCRAFALLAGQGEGLERELRLLRAPLLALLALRPFGEEVLACGLDREVASGQHTEEEPYEPVFFADVLPLHLRHLEAARAAGSAEELLGALLSDERVLEYLRLNRYQRAVYFDRDAYRVLVEGLLLAAAVVDLAEAAREEHAAARVGTGERPAAGAGRAGEGAAGHARRVSDRLVGRIRALRAAEEASGFRLYRLPGAARLNSQEVRRVVAERSGWASEDDTWEETTAEPGLWGGEGANAEGSAPPREDDMAREQRAERLHGELLEPGISDLSAGEGLAGESAQANQPADGAAGPNEADRQAGRDEADRQAGADGEGDRGDGEER